MEQSDPNVPHEEEEKKKTTSGGLSPEAGEGKAQWPECFNDYSSRKMKVYKTEYQLDNH